MRISTRWLIVLVATGTFLFAGSGAGTGAPVPGSDVLYTLDADFDRGLLVNVNHAAPGSNQLQLNTTSGTFPFIWVSLSVRCTIAKIDTLTGAKLGEYRTVADGASCNQSSRTTVALDGSVWVGHRGTGGVTHVGLAELNQCSDRNGNGTIETSTGYDDVKPWPGSSSLVSAAEDECIIHHVDTDSLGLGDSRHMSIDKNNKLWVGSFAGGSKFVRVNGLTGVPETSVINRPCGGYGGLIDSKGVIWSANGSSPGLLRWNPDAPDGPSNPMCINVPNYGLALDPGGSIWVTNLYSSVYKVSPDGGTVLGPFSHGSSYAQGLAVTANGHVWVSSSLFCSSGCTIGHLDNDGALIGVVPNPSGGGSTGVSVDAAGKIWTANLNGNTATRIDPNAGPIGSDGVTPVGAVDLVVDFPAGSSGRPLPYPYNYSDMTGAQLLGSTARQGTWTVTQDSGAAGTSWGKVIWNTEPEGSVPEGASITIEARAADTEAALGGQAFEPVANGALFDLVGRFIEVRATLRPDGEGGSPVLSDIRICSAAASCVGGPPAPAPRSAPTPPADIGVTKTDSPDPVSVGSNLTYTLVVTNHGPGPAPNSAMTDVLPAGVTFLSVSTDLGSCSFGAGRVSCSFGTMQPGVRATVTIVVRVDQAGTLVNRAEVGTTVPDPNVGNNQVAIAVTTAQGSFTPPAVPVASGCGLTTGTPSVFAGVRSVISVRARFDDGSARSGVAVTLRGAGKAQTIRTNAQGIARFTVLPKQASRITIRGAGCGGVLAVRAVRSSNCAGLSVTPKSVSVGATAVWSVRLRIAGKPAVGVRILARGAGLSAAAVTNSAGIASLRGTASRPGVVTITVPGVLTCSKRVGVSGAFQPPEVTG